MANNVNAIKQLDILDSNLVKPKSKKKQGNGLIQDPFLMMLNNQNMELGTLELSPIDPENHSKKKHSKDSNELTNILSLALHKSYLPEQTTKKKDHNNDDIMKPTSLDTRNDINLYKESGLKEPQKNLIEDSLKQQLFKDMNSINITFTKASEIETTTAYKPENMLIINDNSLEGKEIQQARGETEVQEIVSSDVNAEIFSDEQANNRLAASNINIHGDKAFAGNIVESQIDSENKQVLISSQNQSTEKANIDFNRIESYKPILITPATEHSPGILKLELSPASLGKVDIELNVAHDGTVDAVVKAENHEAFYLLSQNQNELRQVIADSFKQESLGGFELSMGMENNHESHNNEQNQSKNTTKDNEIQSLLSLNEVSNVEQVDHVENTTDIGIDLLA